MKIKISKSKLLYEKIKKALLAGLYPPGARRLTENCKAILHWFTGCVSDAHRAVELGCYFSVNEEMLRSPKHRKLVSLLPLERILTETDGPFVLNKEKVVRPRDVQRTVHEIAQIHHLSDTEAAVRILHNLRSLVTK